VGEQRPFAMMARIILMEGTAAREKKAAKKKKPA
jgi:hypothetical protein